MAPPAGDTDTGAAPSTPARPLYPYVVATGLYLALSVLLWGHVWTGHPSAVTTCGCGDDVADHLVHLLAGLRDLHGLDPLFSTAVGYPTGISLIFAPFGIAFAPTTWLFGTIASLNIAMTAIPCCPHWRCSPCYAGGSPGCLRLSSAACSTGSRPSC